MPCGEAGVASQRNRAKYSMIQALKNFLTDERGQDLVEYSLMLVLIGTVVLIYLTGLGLNLATLLQKIGAKLELFANSMS
jgi:Flp pilus assembly pilin Flp